MRLSSLAQAQGKLDRIGAWRSARLQANGGEPSWLALTAICLAALGLRAGVAVVAAAAVALDLFHTVVGALLEVVDSTAGWVLSLGSAPLELAISLPYLGRGVGWIWKAVLTAAWGLLRLPEAVFVLAGIMPEKRLRLWIQSPAGGLGQAERKQLQDAVTMAERILRREANVRLVPVGPFQMDFPAGAPAIEAEAEWLQGHGRRSPKALAVGCRGEAMRQDLQLLGGRIDRLAVRNHWRGGFRRLLGWGAPLMALLVTEVDGGRLAGCSLGPLTDYVTLRRDQPLCLAHEIGHACNLLHDRSPLNLMNPTCGGIHLRTWQVLLLRLSRHVTFL